MKTKMLGLLATGPLAVALALVAALASTQALAQTKENRTLTEAKAYTDAKVATEATQRAQVDDGLQGQVDGLQTQVGELAAKATSPIVISQSPSDFDRFVNPTLPTTLFRLGHIAYFSADEAVIIMPLAAPVSVGGVAYRLSNVEYCMSQPTLGAYITNAVVWHDTPGAPSSPFAAAVSDQTDRTASGCYTLAVPALNPRGYSLGLALAGQSTNLDQAGLSLSSVRTTWVVVTP